MFDYSSDEALRDSLSKFTIESCAKGAMQWSVQVAFNSGIAI